MKVVANTTPLISLASIGKLELLKDIFGEIIIADAVYNETEVSQFLNLYCIKENVLKWGLL